MAIILAVDDSPISRQIYSNILSPLHTLQLAENGESAWKEICNKKIDLIITDVNLPGISGLELLDKITSHEKFENIPCILVSGDSDAIIQAKKSGAKLWLLKPINPESLIKATAKLLSKS